MKTLPADLKAYKKTPHFSADSVPAGLLKAHQTKAGTWATINVEAGALLYRILEPEVEEFTLTPGLLGIIEPQIFHQVKPLGEVLFFVEFFRDPD